MVSADSWRASEADVDVCARLDTHPVAMVAERLLGSLPVLWPLMAGKVDCCQV